MKIGFVSDAHGNPLGLARCLAALDKEGAARRYFLGDAVGYLPEANEVLSLLDSCQAICIRGNHEAMLLGELPLPEDRDRVYRLAEARARLLPKWRSWIETWPVRLEIELDGARLLLVHGSPSDPLQGYVYPDGDLSAFRELPCEFLLMGQTHRPFVASAGAVEVVNVGSSGLPRDVGHVASCAIYDTASRGFEILRVEFDAASLVARWGDLIDVATAACLRRPAAGALVGRTIDV